MIKNHLDFERGALVNYTDKVIRKASDMRGFYENEEELEKIIKSGDPVIYEVYAVVHEGDGELCYAVTYLHPGKVGDEFFMTKGHYHQKRDRGELYIGLRGNGILLMQRGEEVKWYEMHPGDVFYVPPYWAHRSVNTGNEDFVFLAIYPGDAGHDYGSIATRGFAKVVLSKNGKFSVEDNRRYVNVV